MRCHECGSEETISDSGGTYCKKCGLELESSIIYQKGYGLRRDAEKIARVPKVLFRIEPKKELYALKLGLKNNKLTKDWSMLLGFKIKDSLLRSELKKSALILIKKAFEKHQLVLEDSKKRIEENWLKITNKYFREMEKLFKYDWQSYEYKCYLSLICNGGFHNSSKNFIVLQHKWDNASNYVIAHELFHIMFRNYITRFFKDRYDDFDETISEVLVNFILLTQANLRNLFPEIKFSLDMYALDEHREMAKRLWPLWREQKPFKEIMIELYRLFGREKVWVSY
ncbi:TFIIB-type zinc ribbon-containing protein [Candidatus Woesearchaeota archaeon]|nr:TFIIB-type zinc ribbon-containing protein [Candidatus Woesearchaeota archaeon]